ncbi:MAG: conserved rane protein of unknown function, partial [Blastococcus sp.]|nr:conserved rane protein of unknown function [Blastococcus sp.]
VLGDLALRRRLGSLRTRETFAPLLRMFAASAAAGLVGWLTVKVTNDVLCASTAGSLARVLIGTVVIGGVALAGLLVARVPEVREPMAAVRGRTGRG